MKSNLLMNFSVDKENKMVNVKREFDASLSHVWAAWTEADLLDQWWAPAPFKSKTKSMEFKEGGRRLYAMVGPEGDSRWSTFDYTSISPKTNFKHTTTFSDEQGNPNSEFGSSYWDITFSEEGGLTVVDIVITRDSFEELQKIIEMGFKEGFTSALNSLDKIFEAKK
ncbi:SRPBCC family protein [Flavobacterium branchiicola]|uniref:SRPBCC domain-containing protein n=1 Tax=Flavobacterium branchiicola TaxID=1114875 RepID=A0ABV9PJJ1_9FLAO|nr:SRPBCC domain-containing protein [Flavobacterium branchiicola]MBS7255842.1 SRPBCC domain-containing protein [Flavobacterium branchiicola]